MFKGVIHANARAVLPPFIAAMPKRVVNICSGNFTLETTFRMNGHKGAIEGCDISLYTSALGTFYAGAEKNELGIKLRDGHDPDLAVFAKHLETAAGAAAAIAIILDLSEHHKRNNKFQQRIWAATIKGADALMAKTIERLKKKKGIIQLNRFHCKDGVEVIKECAGQPDTLIVSSPPTYEGGYEKLYEWIEKQIIWKKPGYTDIGPAAEFAKLILGAKTDWMLFTEDQRPEVEAIIGQPKAQCARGPNKNVYLYTNLPVKTKLVRRKVEVSADHQFPRLNDKAELPEAGKIQHHRVTFKEANYFRQLFSSVIPMQASAPFCYQFSINGKVFGQVMLSLATFDPKYKGESIGGEYLYMMSDLPVESERHPRLSKLVLACATAKEFKDELEHRTMQPVNFIFTTAFSKNPVSMKYRGAFDFHSRRQQPDGVFAINYIAKTGERRLKQIYKEWREGQYLPALKK